MKEIIKIFVLLIELSKNKKQIITIMNTLIQLILTAFITNNIYVGIYGDYSISIANIQLLNTLFSIAIFCLIFITSYTFETFIFPSLFILIAPKKGKINNPSRIGFILVDKTMKRKFNYNPLTKLNSLIRLGKVNVSRNEFYSAFLVFPTTLILLLIAINKIRSYFLILIVFICMYFFFKIVETIYIKYTTK